MAGRRLEAAPAASTAPRMRRLWGRGGARREEGFALLIVLWTLSLLALMGTHIAATGRTDARIAANLRAAAVAEAAADGAVYQAVFHLLDASPQRWLPDGIMRELTLPGGGIARLRIENESGKVNPNTASGELLQALLLRVGVRTDQAAALAAAILDWRTEDEQPRSLGAQEAQYRAAGLDYAPPGARFESLDELGLVLGMTPDLLTALKPYLSLYNEGAPDLRWAHPIVAQAVAETADAIAPAEMGVVPAVAMTVTVTAAVLLPDGARFIRQAQIRLASDRRGRPWRTLTWRTLDAW